MSTYAIYNISAVLLSTVSGHRLYSSDAREFYFRVTKKKNTRSSSPSCPRQPRLCVYYTERCYTRNNRATNLTKAFSTKIFDRNICIQMWDDAEHTADLRVNSYRALVVRRFTLFERFKLYNIKLIYIGYLYRQTATK